MSPDLHPEELLDRAAAGALSEQERATLDAHLAACAVCRFELQTRADFAAAEVPDLDIDNLVTIALAGSAQATPPASAPVFATRSAMRRRGMLIAAAVAMLGVTSYAAVASYTGVWVPAPLARLLSLEQPTPPPAPQPEPKRTSHAPAVEASPVEVLAAIDVEEPAEVEVDVEPTPVPVAAVVHETPRARPSTSLGLNGPETKPTQAPVALDSPVVETPEIPQPAIVVPSAPNLFAQANEARARGDGRLALSLFVQLRSTYPNSIEAKLSRATVGRLLLDQGNADAALRELDSYLTSGDDSLREEALAARAVALGKLGRAGEEASAWKTLLAEYPDSLQAGRARQRLEHLSSH